MEEDQDQLDEVDKLYRKFENDVHDKIHADKANYRLVESGQPRNYLRNIVTGIVEYAEKRLDAQYRIKLYLYFASDFYEFGEYALALESFQLALDKCDQLLPNQLLATKIRVETMQNIVRSNYSDIMALKSSVHVAPMVVSNLLLCLQQLRFSLEHVFDLPSRQQEGLAWLVLNSCKLIMEIGQPLIWHDCGKYVTETILFGATSMEAVINLCTVRHMKFRMKMYSSAFYSALAHSVTDQATYVLDHTRKQVEELREREELDPPVPDKSTQCLQQCARDMAVMQFLLDFWKDPDCFSLEDVQLKKYYTVPSGEDANGKGLLLIEPLSFADLCTTECIRVHFLAAGNANEPFKKRSTCILKAIVQAVADFVPAAATTSPSGEEKSSSSGGEAEEVEDGSAPTPSIEAPDEARITLYKKFSIFGLLECTILSLFCATDDINIGELLEKLGALSAEIDQYTASFPAEATAAHIIADPDSLEQIQLLLHMHKINRSSSGASGDDDDDGGRGGEGDANPAKNMNSAERAREVVHLVQRFEELVYSGHAYRIQSLLKKVAVELWRKYLYPAIQDVLSDMGSDSNTTAASADANASAGVAAAATVEDVSGAAEEEKSSTTNKNAEQAIGTAAKLPPMEEFAPVLLGVVKGLDVTGIQDPVLMGSLALLAARILWECGDHRGSISLAQKAIQTIENHRAARVDALSHVPEDVRDIFALQRASISTRGDDQDWFHSIKRLGAHAFAGYGIFGMMSSAERGDQAMGEVHADLVAFYFRTEMEYCVLQSQRRAGIRAILSKEEKQRTAHAKALLLGQKVKKDPKQPSTAATTAAGATAALPLNGHTTAAAATATAALTGTVGGPVDASVTAWTDVNAEALHIVATLHGYCSKNAYFRSILLMEMARIDTDYDRQVGYLTDALAAIEECEGREQMLKENFADLLVMTETSRRAPVVVARSHRYLYIAPVGCSRLKKAAYYRVLAKEKGSGTDVSIHNDDLAGCERRIYVDDLTNLRNSVIRIGPLRSGEQYVAASAGFTSEDKVTGGLSPTTCVIEAVNPLSTLLLWSWLAQTADAVGYTPINREASLRVSNRYFMKTPTPTARVVGKGLNLFLFREPSLCMLAIQQSSPLLLQYFVDSLLKYEDIYQEFHLEADEEGMVQTNWRKDRGNQLAALTSLHRTALVSTVACSIQNHDLALRCVKLGYDVAIHLLRFDSVHLATYLQGAMSVLVLSMQTISKRNWGTLEHKLYCILIAHTTKAAAMCNNVKSVLPILNNFYAEVTSDDTELVTSSRPGANVMPYYMAMIATVQQCIASTHISSFLDQSKSLFPTMTSEEHLAATAAAAEAAGASPPPNDIGYVWSVHALQRRLQLTNMAAELLHAPDDKASAEHLQLEKALTTEKPQKMSDLLNALVFLCQELAQLPPLSHSSSTSGVDDPEGNGGSGSSADTMRLLQRFPLCEDYLAPHVGELNRSWETHLLHSLQAIADKRGSAQVSPREAAGKKGGGKGGGDQPTAEELAAAAKAAMEVPGRFQNVSEEEEKAQLQSLGQLCYLLATSCFPGKGKEVNHFPNSTTGPNRFIDPHTFRAKFGHEVAPPPEPVLTSAATPAAAEGEEAAQGEGEAADPNDGDVVSPPLPVKESSEWAISVPLSPWEFLKLLGASMNMLQESGATYSAAQVACTIWNFIVNEWYDAAAFARDFGREEAHILMMMTSLASLYETMSFMPIPKTFEDNVDEEEDGLGDEDSLGSSGGGGGGGGRQMASAMQFVTGGVTFLGDENVQATPQSTQREVKEIMLTLRNLAVFLVKVEWILGVHYWEVVQVGSRFFKAMLMNCPEFLKGFADPCLPLIVNSQETLIDHATKFHAQKEKELEQFVFNYHEAQKKKRKKKLRIARLEKDEEELLFDAERAIYEQRVEEALQALQKTQGEIGQVKAQQRRSDMLCSTGSHNLDRLRGMSRSFLEDCQQAAAATAVENATVASFAQVLLMNPELQERFTALIGHFRPVVSILREKKEKVLLVEALKLQGDLLLYFKCISQAKSVWNDAIDGLFNVMDACLEWRQVAADAVASLEPELVPGIIPAVVALSKLSRYCASQDWDAKAGYARMAAELCRIPFQESYGHPQTVVGFAAYECLEIGGTCSLTLRTEALSARDLSVALQEVIQVLMAERQYIAGLPAVVLLEHFYAVHVRNASLWFSARLMRLRLLIGAHLFAEAAAMLSSIQTMIRSITDQTYSDALRSDYSAKNVSIDEFETSKNGFNFHGYAAFFNNLPPDETTHNAAALQWIAQFPEEFETFAAAYTITLPPPVLTPEEQAAEQERKAREAEAAALAAEAAKKGKKGGKGAEPPAEEIEEDSSIAPLFAPLQVSELYAAVADFLLEISMLDERSTTPQANKLHELGTNGLNLLRSSTNKLYGTLKVPKASNPDVEAAEDAALANVEADPDAAAAAEVAREERRLAVLAVEAENVKMISSKEWLRLFGRIHILRNTYNIHRRQYKQVRANCLSVLKFLQSPNFSGTATTTATGSVSPMCGDTRGILSQTWFAMKDDLIRVAHRQARFDDAIAACGQGAREASMQLAGFWLRSYLLQRAEVHFKLGNLDKALQDCKICVTQYETNKLEDLGLVRALCLQAAVLREQSLYAAAGSGGATPAAATVVVVAGVRACLDALELIRRATHIAQQLAQYSGAYPSDSNVTYGRSDTALRKYHMITPVLHSLTDLHINEPDLSLLPKFDRRKLSQHMGVIIPSVHHPEQQQQQQQQGAVSNSSIEAAGINTTAMASATSPLKASTNTVAVALQRTQAANQEEEEAASASAQAYRLSSLRLAPVDDQEGVYCESEFANIYLRENRTLLACQTLMCQLLDDARRAGVSNSAAYLDEYEPSALINEQLALGESALKLSRHCVYLPIALRVTTLAYVATARIGKRSKFEGDPADFLQTLTGPLTAALKVAVDTQATHLWRTLRFICIALVEVYGDHELELDEEVVPNRLQSAVVYLLAAIKITNQRNRLTLNSIGLSTDASFESMPSDELRDLVVNVSSSSSTPDPAEQKRLAEAEAAAAAAPAAKGGKGGKAPAGGGGAPVPLSCNGRDALYLLSGLLREKDLLWLDNSEFSLCGDMHVLMKQAYPIYDRECCLQSPPAANEEVEVGKGTVSTLWIPSKCPEHFEDILERQPNSFDYSVSGLYSHVSVFLLLGDAGDAAAAGNSNEPILTKLMLPRVDVVFLEKALRDIRDTLIDAEHKAYPEVARNCQEQLGKTLYLLIGLLQNGIVSEERASADPAAGAAVTQSAHYEVTEVTPPSASGQAIGTYSLTMHIPVADTLSMQTTVGSPKPLPPNAGQEAGAGAGAGREGTTTATMTSTGMFATPPPQLLSMTVTPDLLLHFADTLCPDKDMYLVQDNVVCSFIRYCLGYKVTP